MSVRALFVTALFTSAAAAAQIANDPREKEVIETAAKPDSWFADQLGGKRIELDGQTLDLRLQYRLQQGYRADAAEAKARPADAPRMTIDQAFADPGIVAGIRAEANQEWIRQTHPGPELAWTRDEQVTSRAGEPIPVRIYRPKAEGALPVLVYYHGGGWVIGNIAAIDRSMRLLADVAKVMIVAVDYRLAPEHPYPAPWNDAEDAFDWAVANATQLGGSASRICVGGDSAGGNMAVVVTSRTRKAGKRSPACQLLYYAAVDNRPVPEMREHYLSARLFWQGFGLDVPFTDYVHRAVFPGMNLSQPEISPIFAGDIASMPPTLVAAAGFDPLRDSDRAYAAALKKAGVQTVYLEYPSLRHGFLQHTRVTKEADRASRESAAAFGKLVHGLKR
ncbi:alpha/beta hydrolase [Sphingomonas sp.]|uniref:alpha/beta hydrolase n=1 Tax=Sphingomonas sp. TaxID=28214 RepID=UPI002ED84723